MHSCRVWWIIWGPRAFIQTPEKWKRSKTPHRPRRYPNYYGKFVPNLASLLHPMYELLKANQRWVWSKVCEEAFSQAKNHLVEAPVLVHYDPKYPIRVAVDTSNYGIGAVLSHTYPDGSEQPIAFASRTLSSQERNYPQVENEALSLIFGIRKFHKYVYGQKFTVFTDHRPLTAILGPKTGIPTLAAAR